MSGGSFNYLCYTSSEELLAHVDDVRDMERWLRERGKHDAADEVLRFQLELETASRRLSVMHERLVPLMHAAEWWCSSDTDEDDFDKTAERFFRGADNGEGA